MVKVKKEQPDFFKVGMIVDLWKKAEADGDEFLTGFKKEVARMFFAKEISEADILELQNKDFPMGELIDLTSYLKVNEKTKLTYREAIDLAARYHFMLITVVEKEQKGDRSKVRETFPMYEKMINKIYEGTVNPEELAVIKTLPPFDKFDKDEAYKVYLSSIFNKKEEPVSSS